MQRKSFYLVMPLLAILVTAGFTTETWRGPWFVKTTDAVVLGADQSLFVFGQNVQAESQTINLALLHEFAAEDSVRVVFSNDKPVYFSGIIGQDFGGFFSYWFPPEKMFNPGLHILKAGVGTAGGCIKMEFTTEPIITEFGQSCPIFVTEIAIKKVGGSKWQPIDGFAPPDTPYAEGSQLTPVTGDFAEALGEVHGTVRMDGTETRVFYSIWRQHFGPGTKILLVSHMNSAVGTIQWAEGGDYPLELRVDWYGQFNWSDRSDLRAYLVAKATGVATRFARPIGFALNQNHPNPFNSTTNISFALPSSENVQLQVFDITGHEVSRMELGQMSEGQHRVNFNASALPTGKYFYRVQAGSYSATRSMLLIK